MNTKPNFRQDLFARCFRLDILVTAVALLASLFLACSAAAASAPPFFNQFGEGPGTGPGATSSPAGAAVDPVTGQVYISEDDGHRVSEFTAWGKFVKAFGWDVAPGPVNEQQEVRVRAAGGLFKLSFGAGGPGISETADLKFDASAAEVAASLNALTNIFTGGGSVSVSLNPGEPDGTVPYVYVVAFKGALAGTDVPQLSAANGATPLSGGSPSTSLEASTRANGTAGGTELESCTTESGCQEGAFGSGNGQLGNPFGVAVDSSRNLYVVDLNNHRVEKYNSAGEFQLMFGRGVNTGTSGNAEICTNAGPPADVCGPGATGTGPGQFAAWPELSFIAVGPGDKVYVGDENRIQRFASTGAVEPAGEIPLPGKGQTEALAVGSSGDLYVVSQNEPGAVARYDSTGAPEPFTDGPDAGTNTLRLTGEGALKARAALALDVAGNLYVVNGHPHVGAESESPTVLGFKPDGAELFPAFDAGIERSVGVAADPGGDLYVPDIYDSSSKVRAFGPGPALVENPPDVPPTIDAEYITSVGTATTVVNAEITPNLWSTSYYVQYGTAACVEGGWASDCVKQQPLAPGTTIGSRSGTSTVAVALSELEAHASYRFRFVAESKALSSVGDPTFGAERAFFTQQSLSSELPDGRIYELVSPPGKENAEVAVPGNAGGQAQYSVEPQQASPDGEAITYGSFTSFGEPAGAAIASQYLSRRGSGGWSTQNITPIFEEGSLHDPVVGFSPDLSNAAIISLNPPLAPGAPPNIWNLYERDDLSGGFTGITAAEPTFAANGEACVGFAGASADFDRVLFVTRNSALLAGDPVPSKGAVNLYEWHRQPVDASQALTVDADSGKYKLSFGSGGPGVSETGELEAGATRGEVEAALNAISNISSAGGTVTVSGGPGNAGGTAPYVIDFEGGPLALTPQPPLEAKNVSLAGGSASATLATLANGHLALASVLPGGVVAAPTAATDFGGAYGTGAGTRCDMEAALLRHAISTDGTRAFWTYPGTVTSPSVAQEPLFARISGPGGVQTVELDAVQGGAGFGGKGRYQDATPDGSKVFFTDEKKLTPSPANVGDLYRYDVGRHERGEPQPLANLTANAGEAADVQGVVGVSEDGNYAYFVAEGDLSAVPNSHGDSAVPGQPNLYAWHEGEAEPRFVATLSAASDSGDWETQLQVQTARVSPDGHYVAFLSKRSLTGYDNTVNNPAGCQGDSSECTEVYLYDFASGKLTCASCNPSGARPIGASGVPSWHAPYEQPRYLLDGGRLFFESEDALSPLDVNDKRDVYELEPAGAGSCTSAGATYSESAGGCIGLISSGSSPDQSYFLDASADGRDAFISTREALVPQLDKDGAFDVYDARIGGNPPPLPPAVCEGEGCRGAGPAAPPLVFPATSSFQGPGNLLPESVKPAAKPKPKPVTSAQKLAKALKQCKRDKSKRKRAACEKNIRKKQKRRK